MVEARLQLLQSMPIFGGINKPMLELMLSLAAIITVPKGEFFFKEGDEAVSIFALETGKVAILKSWKGHDYLLRYLGAKDCLGEMAWMDLYPRSASVLAVEACRAIELPYSALQRVYEADLEQFAMVQMNMGREVSRRLREADRQLFEARVEAKIIGTDVVFYST